MRRFFTVPRIVTVAMLLALAIPTSRVFAQQPFCLEPLAQRWKSLEDQTLLRANNLKRAREFVHQAEKNGDQALVNRAKALLAKATDQWEHMNEVARQLGSSEYKAFLRCNHDDVERRYNEALIELHRKTAALDRLRDRLSANRESALHDMKTLVEEEAA